MSEWRWQPGHGKHALFHLPADEGPQARLGRCISYPGVLKVVHVKHEQYVRCLLERTSNLESISVVARRGQAGRVLGSNHALKTAYATVGVHGAPVGTRPTRYRMIRTP